VKYAPQAYYMICRALVPKVKSQIVLTTGQTSKNVTRHYLIELVGQEAAKEGYKPGDLIVAKMCFEMHFHRGHRVIVPTKNPVAGVWDNNVIAHCSDFSLEDFVVLPGEESADKIVLEGSNGAETIEKVRVTPEAVEGVPS